MHTVETINNEITEDAILVQSHENSVAAKIEKYAHQLPSKTKIYLKKLVILLCFVLP